MGFAILGVPVTPTHFKRLQLRKFSKYQPKTFLQVKHIDSNKIKEYKHFSYLFLKAQVSLVNIIYLLFIHFIIYTYLDFFVKTLELSGCRLVNSLNIVF